MSYVPPALPAGIPLRLNSVVGRQGFIAGLEEALKQRRVVTIVGPGGIGKSTVALTAAQQRAALYRNNAQFLDLSSCAEGDGIGALLCSQLELKGIAPAEMESIAAALAEAEIFLVLDNCEHVIEEAARLVEQLVALAPGVHVLATSREPLRATGERVLRLPSLEVPPPDEAMSSEEALQFSAVRLFAERASASGFSLADVEVPAVIEICRQLDGIPLAIELAASRMDVFDAKELSARLDDRLQLLATARRTALPRQQTLIATLDWSFETLSDGERRAFTALSTFRSRFSLQSAISVIGGSDTSVADVINWLTGLVAKSLVATHPTGAAMTYKLLETTRHYGWQKLLQDPDRREPRRRHAEVCLGLLTDAQRDSLHLRREAWTRTYSILVADIQAALEWALLPEGDSSLAASLISAAAPLGHQLSMRPEYFAQLQDIVEGAAKGQGTSEVLRVSLSLTHMQAHMRGDFRLATATAQRASSLQEENGLLLPEVLAAQFGTALVAGDYRRALDLAGQVRLVAEQRNEPELATLGLRVSAQALYYLGRFAEAKAHALQVLSSPYEMLPYSVINHRVSMGAILACIAAMEGDFPLAETILQAALEVGRSDNPFSRCLALGVSGIPIAVWARDEGTSRARLAEAREVADRHSLVFWQTMAIDLERGVDHVWGRPPFTPYDYTVESMIGLTNVDTLPTFSPDLMSAKAMERMTSGAVGWNAAELLRIDALCHLESDAARAARRLGEALGVAQRQNAKLWIDRIRTSAAERGLPLPATEADPPGQ